MKKLFSLEEIIWSFVGVEILDEIFIVMFCYFWFSQLMFLSFMKLLVWSKLVNICLNVSGWRVIFDCFCSVLVIEGEINIKINYICSKQFVCKFIFNNIDNCFVVVIFFVEEWNCNSYGEFVVYDKGEILKVVYLKLGRLVIFFVSLEYIIKFLVIDYLGRLYVMKVYLLVLDKRR